MPIKTQSLRRSAILFLGWFSLSVAQATEPANGSRTINNTTTAAVSEKPCPTCPQAIGLEAFQQAVRGEVIPVLVEFQEPPGVLHRLKAERAGRALGFGDLTTHAANLFGKQKAFLASLPRHGIRALLRESNIRQVNGSLRHIQYQLTYLANGFIAYVAREDLARLRALPNVRQVLEIKPTHLLLDKAIDYSLGTQTNLASRRLAVYGATQELQPAGVSGSASCSGAGRRC